jgi:hypothetical protein
MKHVHPGHHASEPASEHGDVQLLAEYVHGTEKKSFIYVLFAMVFAGAYFSASYVAFLVLILAILAYFYRCIRPYRFFTLRSFSYLCDLFSKGIHNPKLFAF